jgi:hypothetical protein
VDSSRLGFASLWAIVRPGATALITNTFDEASLPSAGPQDTFSAGGRRPAHLESWRGIRGGRGATVAVCTENLNPDVVMVKSTKYRG